MIELDINGRKLRADKGQTILQIARDNGIEIPTLCNNEAVEPYGACRMCIVEITRGKRSRIVASCLYPVEDGLTVETNSARVIQHRKVLIELLLARCSQNEVVRTLADQLGVIKPAIRKEYWGKEDCIVCGLCARVCEQVVGVSAISLINRGITKEPASPFLEEAVDCIGCGSCYYACPTNAIKMEDKDGIRYIYNWNIKYKLKKCNKCGNYWAPEKQLEYIQKKWNLPANIFDLCPSCK